MGSQWGSQWGSERRGPVGEGRSKEDVGWGGWGRGNDTGGSKSNWWVLILSANKKLRSFLSSMWDSIVLLSKKFLSKVLFKSSITLTKMSKSKIKKIN